ncbi:helix-turn-helix domain-containing protein [Streptomyces sp. NPDC047072]|uniref:nSTAND1 domain-containing NTPase n=1 Tax=Streptomyces sp. NPDC047072 TaxID=3154809 RepID=UPI0033E1B2AB
MTARRGRPERPVDPAAGPVQRFAHELRSLREAAGTPSYRVMAERAGLSVAALSRAASGDRLPSAKVVRAYARACAADPDEWERRLRHAVEEAAPHCPADVESPYQGLARFEPGDRALFFGRDRLAEEAVELVKRHRFAVLLGASGSGKSSLLRAGVLPRLENFVVESGCDAEIRLITPGPRPAATHGPLLEPGPDDPQQVVVVDQFEEIFTLCRDRAERWRFVDQLLAAKESDGRLRVVVSLGSGFQTRCAEHPGLAETLRHTTLTVGSMSRAELREAVVGPATAAGLRVERELTARIVEEVADQPGALPLLSHALRETWHRRRSGVLTLAAYEAAGGVHGAVAAAAEEVYGRLSAAQTDTARRVLLALVVPGDGTPDSRRPVRRADLREWPDPEVCAVVDRLADARLVTLDQEYVELAHDALITGWPRFQGWIEESRERLRVRRHVIEAARVWQEHGRDPGTLYRGVHLALADALFTRGVHEDDLCARERAFLGASRVADRMERWTADRMRRRMRLLTAVLCCVMGGALVAAQIAWHETGVADGERAQAEARRAAGLAGPEQTADPRTRDLLSVAAWRLAPLPESRAALLDALSGPERDVFTDPGPSDGSQHFLVDSGRGLLDVGGGTWTSWNVLTHRRTGSGNLPELPVTAVSPDGRTLALGAEGERRLWRLPLGNGSGSAVERGGAAGDGTAEGGYAVGGRLYAFGDGRVRFEAAGADDIVVAGPDRGPAAVCSPGRGLRVWRVTGVTGGAEADRSAEEALGGVEASGRTEAVGGVEGGGGGSRWGAVGSSSRGLSGGRQADCRAPFVFSPDGTRLAMGTATGIHVWDTGSGRQVAVLAQPGATRLAFTAGGRFLAAAGPDGVTVWRVTAPDAPVFRYAPPDGPVTALAWDPDHPTLRCLTGGTVHSLDLSAPLTAPWLARPAAGELLSPDAHLLATARREGDGYRFRLLDTAGDRPAVELPALPSPGGTADTVPLMAFSPDGRAFAYGVGEPDAGTDRFAVWDVSARRARALPALGGPPGERVRSLALTAGGRSLLVSRTTADGSVTGELWDTVDGTRTNRPAALAAAAKSALTAGFAGPAAALPTTALPAGGTVGRPLDEGQVDEGQVALSPDGRHLATAGLYGAVTVWRGRDGRYREAVVAPPAGAPGARVTALAFSPDGRTLAVGYTSGDLRLWDVAARQPLGAGLATPGDPIRSLAFDADGGAVYASGDHVPLRRYAIAPAQVVTRLCARAGRDLTGAEWRARLPDVPYRRLCDPPVTVGVEAAAPSPFPPPAPAPACTSSVPAASALPGTARAATPAAERSTGPRPSARAGSEGHRTARPSASSHRGGTSERTHRRSGKEGRGGSS